MNEEPEQQFATQCRYLRITLGSLPGGGGGGLINLCQHIIREDRECVGPFLDETETTCGLWELHPRFAEKRAAERLAAESR